LFRRRRLSSALKMVTTSFHLDDELFFVTHEQDLELYETV
jgi:hypothetical protein